MRPGTAEDKARNHTNRTARGKSGEALQDEPQSWEEVNQKLACLGELERQTQGLASQFEQKMTVLKQQWLEANQPLVAERKRLEQQIERFYWSRRGEVLAEGRKSVELAFGRLGTRHSRSVEIQDPAGAGQWLVANGLDHYLRIRREIDREAIRAALLAADRPASDMPHALLACPAIRMRQSEQFWYELIRAGGTADGQPGRRAKTSNHRGVIRGGVVREASETRSPHRAGMMEGSRGLAIQHAT